ncbi:hypothetical protein BpHYR1_027279 [Brachionus plicatilis]|uniref:Uncharacterized protein n=1 Tax=Brachionus plicatilis TaxID=10195 RepID=A0A3M7RB26_BRAPC|nr:hypothetical protein BpHYR1_027279 [Brachionus plicatilis]
MLGIIAGNQSESGASVRIACSAANAVNIVLGLISLISTAGLEFKKKLDTCTNKSDTCECSIFIWSLTFDFRTRVHLISWEHESEQGLLNLFFVDLLDNSTEVDINDRYNSLFDWLFFEEFGGTKFGKKNFFFEQPFNDFI